MVIPNDEYRLPRGSYSFSEALELDKRILREAPTGFSYHWRSCDTGQAIAFGGSRKRGEE